MIDLQRSAKQSAHAKGHIRPQKPCETPVDLHPGQCIPEKLKPPAALVRH